MGKKPLAQSKCVRPLRARCWTLVAKSSVVVLGCLGIAGPVAAQSPTASASLSSGSSFQARAATDHNTMATQQLWFCEGFAASSEPWHTASVYLRLKLDNTVLQDAGYAANYWGATYSLSWSVALDPYPHTLTCEILVNDPNGSASDSASAQIGPNLPADLRSVPPDTFTYVSPGDYLRYRIWSLWDSSDNPWDYTGHQVSEDYWIGNNGCNLQFITATTTTNNQGRFNDRYGNYDGNHTIPACQIPQYQSCQTQSLQTISVSSTSFVHDVVWGCFNVEISRQ